MQQHLSLNDTIFEEEFSNGTLNPALFNHEAHLRLAWIHLRRYGEEKAIENICRQIQAFAIRNGANNKYNKTLTIAAIKAVHHFMEKSPADSFIAFITQCSRLKTNFRDLMACHYRTDIFNSEIAKKEFLEPDLLPFSY